MMKNTLLLNKEDIQKALDYIGNAPEASKLNPDERQQLCQLTETVLDSFAQKFGENTAFEISFKKRLFSTDLRISVPGILYNPLLTEKQSAIGRSYELISNYLVDRAATAFFTYIIGKNVVSVKVPKQADRESSLRAIISAILLGLLLGFLSRLLPENVSGFLIDNIVSPVNSLLLSVLSGVMGPVIFLSLLSSVTMLNDISELNKLGKLVIRRFVLMTVFVTLLSILICLILFGNFGESEVSILPGQIVNLFLGMIPVNLFKPFVDGNVPQLLVLALGMGAALLIMGERGTGLKSHLGEISIWLNTFSSLVNKVAPVITFLNLMSLAATGRLDTLIHMWKYIAGVLLCLLVYTVWKVCFVSCKRALHPLLLLRKLKPIIAGSFVAVSGTQKMRLQMQTADEFGIQKSFSEFWIPMSYAMLYPLSSVCCVVSAFCAAQMSGMNVSESFLIVLLILAVQLSLASPGLVSSMIVVFGQLGLSVEYIGVFNACRLIVDKVSIVFAAVYTSLEELDAAFAAKAVNETRLSEVRNPSR